MGSVVKGIGKAVKGIGKLVKKVAPYAILAAGLYFGVGAYGASLLGGTAGAGSMAAFKAGLSGIGAKFGMSTAMSGQVSPFGWVQAVKNFGSQGGSSVLKAMSNPADQAAGLAGNSLAGQGVSGGKGLIGGLWNSLGDYGKMAAIQGATTIGASLLAGEEESAFEEQRKAMEIGIDGRVLDAKGNTRDAVNITQNPPPPNAGLASVDRTYSTQAPAKGLIQTKPQVPMTTGPSPNDVMKPKRGLIA